VQNNPTTISVVAAALIDSDGRVLVHQRKFGGPLGGLWEFPGGKVEVSENPASALIRELDEELGIAVDPADLQFLDQASEPGNPHVVLLYTCRRWSGDPVCLAGEAIGWVWPSELLTLEMPPLDVPLARTLISSI
jgi:8-oxo-dGTP diphosphatase